MKLAIQSRAKGGFIIIYQRGPEPVLGDDAVIPGISMVECLRKLADWLEQRYG
jgi:hypothetical protein